MKRYAHIFAGFALSVSQVNDAVREAKQANLDPEVSRLIEIVRIPGERKPRIEAVGALAEKFPSQSYIDKNRIVDTLVFAIDDNDRGFRHFPVSAIGKIAEQAYDDLADKIARELGQKIDDRRYRPESGEAGERAELLIAYARTGGHAHLMGARHPDQFLDGAVDEFRESDVRGKVLSMRALNLFLGRASSAIFSERREFFGRALAYLMPMPHEFDVTVRSEYVKALVFHYRRRGTVLIDDPVLRQRLVDKLEEMYRNETNASLRHYLRSALGH